MHVFEHINKVKYIMLKKASNTLITSLNFLYN